MAHDKLLEIAKKAISELNADTSVSAGKTKSSLETLRDEINMYIDALGDIESEDD